MLTIFVLFVGLTLATAVIAYWSDNLGKKLGKKRVSLWGLRPRTTATFLTIASSWLIMVFTLAVLLGLFSPLRQALLRFDEVKAQEQSLRISKDGLEKRVGNLNARLTELTTQSTKAQRQLGTANQQLKQSRQAVKRARDESEQAVAESGKAQKRAAIAAKRADAAARNEKAARAKLGSVRGELRSTKAQRAAAQRQYDAAKTQLDEANSELDKANRAVQLAKAKVETADAQVEQANAELDKVQSQLSLVQTNLRSAQASEKTAQNNAKEAEARAKVAQTKAFESGNAEMTARGEVFRAQAQVEQAQDQLQQLQVQAQNLEEQNRVLLARNTEIVKEANDIYLSDVRVPVDRTIVARSFEPGASVSVARDELRALFERAATRIVPGLLPGARLQLLPLLGGDADDPVALAPDRIYTRLAALISLNQNPISVRLVAARNHRAGDKVLDARFVIVPIRRALDADSELASVVLDGRAGDDQIFSNLLKLADAGRRVAEQSGVQPPLSPEAPDFYAPGSNVQIFRTLRALSAINGPARVSILTQQPTSTADQLRVRFDIEALAPTTSDAASVTPAPGDGAPAT